MKLESVQVEAEAYESYNLLRITCAPECFILERILETQSRGFDQDKARMSSMIIDVYHDWVTVCGFLLWESFVSTWNRVKTGRQCVLCVRAGWTWFEFVLHVYC